MTDFSLGWNEIYVSLLKGVVTFNDLIKMRSMILWQCQNEIYEHSYSENKYLCFYIV